jgi:antitoxin MazE
MKSRVRKWGHSLALIIPKPLARRAGLAPETVVELALVNGQLVIARQSGSLSLEALLAGITPANRHSEIDFGDPIGNEKTVS